MMIEHLSILFEEYFVENWFYNECGQAICGGNKGHENHRQGKLEPVWFNELKKS
ncbi:MAG: hypothetical protein MZV70_18660 [Desulfobacterales bacterium]|nr:hypothetical protein [Desulfobacterales bacterium]